jgi:hypothetical protein
MVLIPVPKPPKSAMNPDRPVSTLLRNQMRYLQEAEFRLPVKMQTNVYINSIKTEGEAADYIRRVTEALHKAHKVGPSGHAAQIALVPKRKSMRGPDIAVAAEKPKRKSQSARNTSAGKKKTSKRRVKR